MAKTTQCMKLNVYGRCFSVIMHHDDPYNKFWLYEITSGINQYGYRSERKHLLEKYANFNSILFYLHTMNLPEFRRDW